MAKATQRRPKRRTSKREGLRPARPTVEGYARAIIKDLEVVVACSGWRAHEVFEDWLELVYFTLQRAPEHIRARAAHLPAPPDPPIIAQAFARARLRYGRHWHRVQTQFSRALALAQLAAQDGIIDVVGPIWPSFFQSIALSCVLSFYRLSITILCRRVGSSLPQLPSGSAVGHRYESLLRG